MVGGWVGVSCCIEVVEHCACYMYVFFWELDGCGFLLYDGVRSAGGQVEGEVDLVFDGFCEPGGLVADYYFVGLECVFLTFED